jgi:hypothetical protein
MRTIAAIGVALAFAGALAAAQEKKSVPKDSARVTLPGCTKGYIFTAGPRTVDEPGSTDVPEGAHFRMNGPKDLIKDIQAHEGSMIEIVGIVKKGQYQQGVGVGGGVRISPGAAPGSSVAGAANLSQNFMDVEGWRQLAGACRIK